MSKAVTLLAAPEETRLRQSVSELAALASVSLEVLPPGSPPDYDQLTLASAQAAVGLAASQALVVLCEGQKVPPDWVGATLCLPADGTQLLGLLGQEVRSGQSIEVRGLVGGAGTSLVAAGLAQALPTACLIDCGAGLLNLADYFGAEQGGSLRWEQLSAPGPRLGVRLRQGLPRRGETAILSGHSPMDLTKVGSAGLETASTAAGEIIRTLAGQYAYLVLDCGSGGGHSETSIPRPPGQTPAPTVWVCSNDLRSAGALQQLPVAHSAGAHLVIWQYRGGVSGRQLAALARSFHPTLASVTSFRLGASAHSALAQSGPARLLDARRWKRRWQALAEQVTS